MAEFLNPAVLEEQQEEITVLQSIFEDDLQMLERQDGKSNICFTLTIKVNIPFERIDFEAFIPAFEEIIEERSTRLESSGRQPEAYCKDEEEMVTMSDSRSHSDTQEDGAKPSVSSLKSENKDLSESSIDSFAGRTKRTFSRSVSRRHWHVRADVQYLTLMHLTCTFPPLYPTEFPPEFSVSCLWLTSNQIQQLQEKLTSLWTETPYSPIVFTWADWLQNYTYEYLRLGSHLVFKTDKHWEMAQTGRDDEAQELEQRLQTALLTIFEYDLEMQRQAFQQGTHLCEICFDERDGAEFHYLDECRHFFCNDCLKAHCELHVESGTVLKLTCPNYDCKTMIPPEILQDVLDAEKLERWERLLLSKTLDVMGDVVYCPRCNVAVVIDEDESSRLGHCANCFFAFCTECHKPWHHGQPCFEEESDLDDEESAENATSESRESNTKDKEEEKGKEQGKGVGEKTTETGEALRTQQSLQREKVRKILAKSVNTNVFQKNMSNMAFIRKMKKKGEYQYCPKCRMAVERISGCDMMYCTQCHTNFCWLCGARISAHEHIGSQECKRNKRGKK